MNILIKASLRLAEFKRRLAEDKSGAALVEYSVLVGLITIATVALITTVGESIHTIWDNLNNTMTTAAAAGGGGAGG